MLFTFRYIIENFTLVFVFVSNENNCLFEGMRVGATRGESGNLQGVRPTGCIRSNFGFIDLNYSSVKIYIRVGPQGLLHCGTSSEVAEISYSNFVYFTVYFSGKSAVLLPLSRTCP